MLKVLLLVLMLTGFAVTVFAQADQQAPTEDKELKKNYLYKWTDGKGVVHITDSLGKVPKQYRDKAIKEKQQNKEGTEQDQSVQPEQRRVRGDDADEVGKDEWQQRMRRAKLRLSDAESRYQELDQRRNELLQSWGGVASGRLAERSEADTIEQQMKDVQKQIDDARRDIEIVIPEEARKAGVPPGWFRE